MNPDEIQEPNQSTEPTQPAEQKQPEVKTAEIPATVKQEPIKFFVEMNSEDVPGIYSNAVSVRVQSQEVVLDFGYIVPKIDSNDKDIIRLVKRINLPLVCAGQMAKMLMGAMQSTALDQMIAPKT